MIGDRRYIRHQQPGEFNHRIANRGAYIVPMDAHEDAREPRVMSLAREGKSVRTIAYLTGIPRSTVGDILTRSKQRIEPAPFYRLVEF